MPLSRLATLNRTGGQLVRSVEFAIISAFALGAWGLGADEFFWPPILVAGFLIAALCISTTEWTNHLKWAASSIIAAIFVLEAAVLYLHSHPTERRIATSAPPAAPAAQSGKFGETFFRRPLTMRDLFDTDYTAEANGFGPTIRAQAVTMHARLRDLRNGKDYDIPCQVVFDIESNSRFVTYYIPGDFDSFVVAMGLSVQPDAPIRDLDERMHMSTKDPTDTASRWTNAAPFSHQVIIYFEQEPTLQQQAQIEAQFNAKHVMVQFRGQEYWAAHMKDHRLQPQTHKMYGLRDWQFGSVWQGRR